MSDYIETNSKFIERELQRKILKKNLFLPNMILKPKIDKHDYSRKIKNILAVANVKEEKNIDLFLSLALKIIKRMKI